MYQSDGKMYERSATLYITIHICPVFQSDGIMYECSTNIVHQYVSQVSCLPVKMRECINVNGTLRCPRSPVCGSDGRTYGNECQLRSAGCTRQQEIQIVSMDNCDGQYLPSFYLPSFFPFLSSLSFLLSFPHLSSFQFFLSSPGFFFVFSSVLSSPFIFFSFFLSSPGFFVLMFSFFLLSILHSFLPFLFSI